MLLIRDARSSVTGAPIAPPKKKTYQFMKTVTAKVTFIIGLRSANVLTLP
jgi:hypothetical protein